MENNIKEQIKTVTTPGVVLLFEGKLVKVVGTGEGKTIHMQVISDEDKDKCPHCGKPIPTELAFLEHSPMFQGGAKPVLTIE